MNSGSAVVVPVPDPIDRESNKERGATDYLPGDTGLRNHPGGSNVPPSSGCLGFLRSESTDTALHETIKGYCTAQSRTDWCKYHGIMFESVRITKCLNADRNPKAPLYYWQLFSLIGVDMIKALITDFYEIVFADSDAAWFRDVFVKNGDIDHHIRVQSWYWCDAMGGGAHYHGGEDRLNFHHGTNAGKVVMSAAGAKRWMEHMRTALISRGHVAKFNALDRRICPCLVDFLQVKMEKYSIEFKWDFDKRPFDDIIEYARNN